MIRAFRHGRTSQEIADFFGVPLAEVVEAICTEETTWTVETAARLANTSVRRVEDALREACTIWDDGQEAQLRDYVHYYRENLCSVGAHGYTVGYRIGQLFVLYQHEVIRNTASVSLQVALRRLDLLMYMHEQGCSVDQISVAVGMEQRHVKKFIEKFTKSSDSETESSDDIED